MHLLPFPIDQIPVELLMQKGRYFSVKQKFSFQLHRQTVSCKFKMVINVRILTQNVVIDPTTQSLPTNQTHPQPFALVALLAEFDDRGLLMVPAEGTNGLGPFFKTREVEIVSAEDGDGLVGALLEADGADQLVCVVLVFHYFILTDLVIFLGLTSLIVLLLHFHLATLPHFPIMIGHKYIFRPYKLHHLILINRPQQIHLVTAAIPLHQPTETQTYLLDLPQHDPLHLEPIIFFSKKLIEQLLRAFFVFHQQKHGVVFYVHGFYDADLVDMRKVTRQALSLCDLNRGLAVWNTAKNQATAIGVLCRRKYLWLYGWVAQLL